MLRIRIRLFSGCRSWSIVSSKQCCGSGMLVPDPGSGFFLPGFLIWIFHPRSNPQHWIKEFLTQKFVTVFSELWSEMFIPYHGSGFFITDPGSWGQKALDPWSGSTTLHQNDAHLQLLAHRSSTAPGWASMVPLWNSHLPARHLLRVRLPAFSLMQIRNGVSLDADPDLASQNDADPDQQYIAKYVTRISLNVLI